MLFLIFLLSKQCWSMWYDSVLCDANMVDYRAMWFFFWNLWGSEMVYPMLDQWWRQCAIPWSWDCWVFWVGDNQQHLFPPIRFYNGYCTIGFTWSMLFLWYDSVLWDANLVDDRAMWIFENLWGSEMVYPMLDQRFFQGYHEGDDFRPSAVCNPLLLGIVGYFGWVIINNTLFHP